MLLTSIPDWQSRIDRSIDGLVETFRSYPGARQSPAIEAALAQLNRAAPVSVARTIKAQARHFLAEPWRLGPALYPTARYPEDVVRGMTMADLVCEARRLMGHMRSLVHDWPDAYSSDRMLTLRGAYCACRVMQFRQRKAGRVG